MDIRDAREGTPKNDAQRAESFYGWSWVGFVLLMPLGLLLLWLAQPDGPRDDGSLLVAVLGWVSGVVGFLCAVVVAACKGCEIALLRRGV